MGDNVGTLRSVTIAGPSYPVAADADISVDFTEFNVEGIATSDTPIFKYTKKTETAETIPLMLSMDQLQELRDLFAAQRDVTIGFTTANDALVTSTGRFSLGKWTSAEGRCETTLIPVAPWAIFS